MSKPEEVTRLSGEALDPQKPGYYFCVCEGDANLNREECLAAGYTWRCSETDN